MILDDRGLVPGSAWCTETRRLRTHDARIASITRLVESSLRQHEIHLVAIGRSRDVVGHESLASEVVAVVSTLGVAVEVLDEHALVDAFRVPGTSGFDHLGQTVSRVFFPELAGNVPSWRRGHEERRRRIRPLWKATAAALVALAKLRPDAVRALAREPLPPGLLALLDSVSIPRV
ncbi:MAG: hypothetical protein IT379_14935 [Deltaproteobacteria bacterium]|nr:hypothetical protein [Deltaproteobacteria bacterium]